LWGVLWYIRIIVGPWHGLHSTCSASRALKLVERILLHLIPLRRAVTILTSIFNA